MLDISDPGPVTGHANGAKHASPHPLFDPEWYRQSNPDIPAHLATFAHYLSEGWRKLKSPHPLFSVEYYFQQRPDIREAGIEPLGHFVTRGWKEHSNPHPLFDLRFYLFQKADLGGTDPLTHYVAIGWKHGVKPNRRFDPSWYVAQNPDVLQSGHEPLSHYLSRGWKENRWPTPWFDPSGSRDELGEPLTHYAMRNPDVFAAESDPKVLSSQKFEGSSGPANEWKSRYFSYLYKQTSEFVPRSAQSVVVFPQIRTIAFYLPQFHRIAENDLWWGEGFTEWTNVTRALPQFIGHYQPHLPRDLGFYNLLDPRIQVEQVSIARQYGVSGFCFYFYWFAGKTLLEQPVDSFASNPDIDFPFCLCWANENWSRRWDGLENDVLIAQKHSPEDDVAFISYIAKYIRNKNYIKVNGRPLLIVYRPNLFPAMRETAERWRTWCMENGIGEIHLAMTFSFEYCDPTVYGLDSGIEFPPNNSNPPKWSEELVFLNSKFEGSVYDWRVFPERSRGYAPPEFHLHRGVCLPWDNEPRRSGRGTILLGATPAGYLEWLENACVDTLERIEEPSERLVFINAWNEWAEGAHLEPDQRYGFAYLEATRMALIRSAVRSARQGLLCLHSSRTLAVVVHAFYLDVFQELLPRLKSLPANSKLFVTTSPAHLQPLTRMLEQWPYELTIRAVENRGRDVAPFLDDLRELASEGFEFILKVHTKKSLHRTDGSEWRDELFDSLLGEGRVAEALGLLNEHPEVGIIGPQNHVVSMEAYFGSNEAKVRWLASRLGITEIDLRRDVFVAGTMFFARTAALMPLLNLGIRLTDFEVEQGQVDGTLAHAIERVLSYSAQTAGYTVAAAKQFSDVLGLDLAEEPTTAYRFAEKTLGASLS